MSNHPLLSFRSQFLQGHPWQKFIKYTPTPWLTLLWLLSELWESFKSHVSEICVKRIWVNQGVGVNQCLDKF